MTLSRYLLPILFSVIITLDSCKKPSDVHCETAVLEIHNPDLNRAILFYWDETVVRDTIFPGESVFTSVNNVHVEYDMMGEVKSSTAPTVTIRYGTDQVYYQVDECHKVVEASGGFLNFKPYCNDGVYNPEVGEDDIDCGPFCTPCGEPNLNCKMANDELDWTESGLRDGFVYDTRLSTDNGLHYTFDFYSSPSISADFKIKKLPNSTKRFEIGYGDHQVKIIYGQGYNQYPALENQFVYLVKEDNGDWFLEFCELEFANSNLNFHGSAKFALVE